MPTETEYFLPFDASIYPVRISQGNNGPWSHKLQTRISAGFSIEEDMSNAVDFALPVETEVRAARGGKIFGQRLRSNKYYEGLDPEIGNSNAISKATNYIVIMHEDGTWSWYSHLAPIQLAQRTSIVRAGDVIALTGKSGWIAEVPHLHFMVTSATTSGISLPITFQDYTGSLDHETLAREGKIWYGE